MQARYDFHVLLSGLIDLKYSRRVVYNHPSPIHYIRTPLLAATPLVIQLNTVTSPLMVVAQELPHLPRGAVT